MVETSCKETRKKPSRFIDTNTSKLDSLLLEFHSYKPMKWMELNEGNGRASRGSILISLLSLENEIWCHKFEIRSEDVWWRGWAFKWHLRSSSSMGWSKEKEKHQGRQLNGRLQTSPDSNSKLATSFFFQVMDVDILKTFDLVPNKIETLACYYSYHFIHMLKYPILKSLFVFCIA